MSSAKERRKARRRAEKMMDEAWEACLDGHTDLGARLSRRAVELGVVNPRLWLDHGRILAMCGADDDCERALRQAIAIAPTFAEAFAELAKLQARRGKIEAAVRLQERAVQLDAGDEQQIRWLEGYRARLPAGTTATEVPPAPLAASAARTERYDWQAVEVALRQTGMTRLSRLLTDAECDALIATWHRPTAFEHEVALDDDDGRVEYRFLTRPLPNLVSTLRRELYARLAPIANAWNEQLGRRERYPTDLESFLAHCHQAGQLRPSPILLYYPEGGFNAPHRDIAGRVVFPLQVAVTLGPGNSLAGDGGELLLVDERPGRGRHRHQLPTGIGDAAVFCSRKRLVEIGGAVGLQPVSHGVAPVHRERYALGLPFHEHG